MGARRGPAPVVPMAARPAAAGRRRQTIGQFELMLIDSIPANTLAIDPMMRTVGCHPKTWSWVKDDQAALGMFVHEKAEAVRLMKVVMYDVAPYAPQADPERRPPPMGITLLCRDLQRLVGDMTKLDPSDQKAVHAMAVRYGRMRDTMSGLRAAFTEAEGSFETAQLLLVQKMGLD